MWKIRLRINNEVNKLELLGSKFSDYYVNLEEDNYKETIISRLKSQGIVTFEKDFSREEYVEFSKLFGKVHFHNKSGHDGADVITNIYEQEWYRKFTARTFDFHTDLSKDKIPPTLLGFYCKQAAETGGESTFVDGKQLYYTLKEKAPHIWKEVCRPSTVIFGEDAIMGAIFEKAENNNIFIRYRYDNLVYFSPPIINVLPELHEIMQELTISFKLENNQGYLVNNGVWLHGRKAWTGERSAFRIMLNSGEEKFGNIHLGFNPNEMIREA